MAKLTSISVAFSAKLIALYMVVVGMLAGIAYAVGGAVYDAAHGGFNEGTWLAFLALLGMPAAFALAGLIAGALLAAPVSWLVRVSGGLKIPDY